MEIQVIEEKKLTFTIDQVMSVYLGKANKCMCGCSGNYAYTKKNATLAGKDRGYAIGPEEISDNRVRTRIARFLKLNSPAESIEGHILTKCDGERQITIYLKK